MPGCLALLLPDYCADPNGCWRRRNGAARSSARAPGWRWNCRRGHADNLHRERVLAAAARSGLPLAASGAVTMHVRSRKPLADVLTAIRLRQPLSACGLALAPNAGAPAPAPAARAPLSAGGAGADGAYRLAVPFLAGRSALRVPGGAGARGRTAIDYLREGGGRGGGSVFPRGCRSRGRSSWRKSSS